MIFISYFQCVTLDGMTGTHYTVTFYRPAHTPGLTHTTPVPQCMVERSPLTTTHILNTLMPGILTLVMITGGDIIVSMVVSIVINP